MSEEKTELLKAIDVAYELKITIPTLTNWYKWYNGNFPKPENVPELPKIIRKGDMGCNNSGTRYWKKEDLEKLKTFQKWLPKGRCGIMGAYNKRFWAHYKKKEKNNG